MSTRFLRDLEVSEIGMGCMGFSHGYGKVPDEAYALQAVRKAYDFGCTFFDTAEGYGKEMFYPGHNEELLGKALASFRQNVVLATKFHISQTKFEGDDVRKFVPQLSRENIVGNQPILNVLAEFANRKSASCAQISLAWMLYKYPNVVPIPGSKSQERILENLEAWNVKLTESELLELETALNSCTVYGHRGYVESEQRTFSNNWIKTNLFKGQAP